MKTVRPDWATVEQLCEEVCTVERAGMSVPEGLRFAAQQLNNKPMRKLAAEAAEGVEQGRSLSEVLKQQAFPGLMVSLVRAGEHGGDMLKALKRMGEYTRVRRRVTFAFRMAAFYPAAVLSFALVISCLVTFGIIPNFMSRVDSMRALIPESSALFPRSVYVALWVQKICVAGFALASGACIFLAVLATVSPSSRLYHTLLLRTPLFCRFFRQYLMYSFSSAMSVLLQEGVPVDEALQVLRDLRDSPLLEDASESCLRAVSNGRPLSDGLQDLKWYPESERYLLRHAESDERMPEHFTDLSDRSLAAIGRLEKLFRNLEPGFILALSILIAIYLFSVALPLSRFFTFIRLGD